MNGYYEKHRDELPVDCWQIKNDCCEAHFHSSLELVYVIEGQIEVFSGGQQIFVTAGQALLSPSYSLHYYNTPKSSCTLNLTLPLDTVPSFKSKMKNKRFIEFLYIDDNKLLYNALKELAARCAAKSTSTLIYKGLSYYILGLLTEVLGTEEYHDSRTRIFNRDALVYLQENFNSQATTLENTAKNFGYSKSRFAHLFTATFGYTFYEYLTLLRCRNAASLIINENSEIIDAAMNSGFENMRTFYRAFKKTFDKTPSEFKKENVSFFNE